MREKHIGCNESKGIFYGELEEFAREKIREHLQDLLAQEVTEWLGREKSDGYGKTRRFTMSVGTVEIGRPRVRDLDERFVSKVLLPTIPLTPAQNPHWPTRAYRELGDQCAHRFGLPPKHRQGTVL